MTSQEALEKLGALVENSTTGVAIMAAVEVYGDARELEGHAAACGNYKAVERPGAPMGMGPKCGDEWYCDKAPRRTV